MMTVKIIFVAVRIIVDLVQVFTARGYASAVYAVVVCPSVCHKPAVYQTVERKITETLSDSPRTLVV